MSARPRARRAGRRRTGKPRRASAVAGVGGPTCEPPDPSPVRHWMSGRVITIGETTAALAAWELMAKHGIRHFPVVDIDRRLIGIVSDRDLRQAILQQSLQQAGVRPDLRMLRVSE